MKAVPLVAESKSLQSWKAKRSMLATLKTERRKMAARPFVDKIKEKATPEIEKIYKEPYG